MSPKKYRKQLFDLGIEGMEIDASTIDNAMDTLNQLNELEKVLNKMRYNVRADIRNIRLDYMGKLQEIDKTGRNKAYSVERNQYQQLFRKRKSSPRKEISQSQLMMLLKIPSMILLIESNNQGTILKIQSKEGLDKIFFEVLN